MEDEWVARWCGHSRGGADVGIGDVFDVLQLKGTEHHAVALRAQVAARADSAAAAAEITKIAHG